MATDPSGLIAQLLSNGGVNGFQQGYQQAQQTQQQTAQNAQALQMGQMKMQQAQDAQLAAQQQAANKAKAMATYQANPSHQNLQALALAAPDEADAAFKGAGLIDDDAKKSQLTQNGVLFNLADQGTPDQLTSQVTNLIAAEKSAGIDTSQAQTTLQQLQSGDPAQIAAARKSITAQTRINLSVLGAKGFEIDPKAGKGDGYTLSDGQKRFDANNNLVASGGEKEDKPEYQWDETRGAFFLKPGTGGGGLASSGGGGDTSRLINSDAGGGYVPTSVQTLGQFVNFGKSLNGKGAKSSSAGTYQINGSTMAQFGPKALGPNWQSAPFNADTQDKVGEAIFDWAKQQSNPAAALKSRWVSLSPANAAQLVQGDWSQARGVIAQGETGGGVGSSASAPGGGYPQVVQVADPKTIGGGAPGASLIPDGLNGLDAMTYLKNKNPGLAGRVQAVLDTRAPLPATSTRNPINNAIAAAVNQIDPTFDQQAWKRRAETVQQYSPGGKVGQQLLSAKTSIDHLYDMAQSAQSLPDHYFGFMNSAANASTANGSQAGQNLIRYNEGRKIVSTELAKFLTGKAPAEGEIKQNYDSYDPSKGATGIKTALSTDIDYLGGKLQPLVQAYKDNTGKDFNIDAQIPGGAVNAKLAALTYYRSTGSLPTVVSSPLQAAKLPSGSVFVTPDGKVRTKH